jgi:hypothetical protein
LLYTLVGGVPGPTHPALVIGLSLAKIGDVDDDGRDDFVMGCGEPTGRGAAVVVSGATGAYLRLCYGELVGDGLGEKVTECGDIDGDGYADFALGNGGNIFAWRGVVRFFSSRTGQVLHQLVSQPFSLEFGRSLASRGVDLDGDGKADVVVGQAGTGPVGPLYGSVHTFSGRDGSRLHSVASQPPQAGSGGQIGYFATTLRPRAGEHIGYFSVPNPTTLFGAGSTCGHHYGAIVTYKGLPRTAVTLGPSCRGNLTAPPNIGMSSLGTPGVRIHLSNAPAGSLAVLLLGLSTTNHHGVPLPASLDHLGLPGCSLRTSIELMCTAITGAAASATGHASIDLPFPVPSVGLGTWSLSAQWLVLGDATTFPGGMSQAIRWRR